MAHEILATDHMVSGNNIIPWHKLGTVVDGLMTSKEVLEKARLNWTVDKRPIQIVGGKTIANSWATVRSDTGEGLGVVGKVYTPIQNVDGLNILDPVIGEDAVYETAGSLRGGKIVWLLASLKKEYFLRGSEQMKQYFLVYLTHDGSRPASVRFVSTRVVCMNTLACALGEESAVVTIRHTRNFKDRIDEVHKLVGLADRHARDFEKIYEKLSNEKMNEKAAKGFTELMFPGEAKQTLELQDQLFSLFRGGIGNEGKTRADMLNATTEYVSHHKAVRVKDVNAKAEKRFENAFFGDGLKFESKALDLLLSN